MGGAGDEQIPSRQRSLIAYLTMPRPVAVYGYGSLPVMAYGLVHLMGEADEGVPVAAALVAWLVFEVGLYQLRYLVNDVIDADVDRTHVAAAARGRLPAVPQARRRAVQAAAARLAASAVLLALLPGRVRAVTLVAVLGLVAAALAYEANRASIRRRRAQGAPEPGPLSLGEAGVFVLVGAGKGVRVGFGLALAGIGGWPVLAGIAFGWAYGAMAEIMCWTLEAAGLRSGEAHAVLARKSHIARLAGLIGDDPVCLRRPLLAGPPARLAGWLFAAASATAVALGFALVGSEGIIRLVVLLLVAAVIGPWALVRRPSTWAGRAVMAADAAAAALLTPAGGRLGMAVLLLFVSGVAATLRSFTPADMKLAPPAAGTAVR